MSISDSISDKLTLITEHIIAEAASLPTFPVNQKQNTIDFYLALVANLDAAINAYRADTVNKTTQLRTLVMDLQQHGVMSSYTSDGFAVRCLDNSNPKGYDDLFELYNCDGLYDFLRYSDTSMFYDGPITTDPIPDIESLAEGQYLLHDLTKQAEGAEAYESAQRSNLHWWINSANVYNSFALIFETPNGSVDYDPANLAEDIYVTRNAIAVIEEYGLDVYIPTYLRE